MPLQRWYDNYIAFWPEKTGAQSERHALALHQINQQSKFEYSKILVFQKIFWSSKRPISWDTEYMVCFLHV